ncbi:MAG: cytochrome P460 family protein [Flavobacteriaceae bacterium]|nr:cytochrome P460 family protein [Flavobacteriaceae bacterium]
MKIKLSILLLVLATGFVGLTSFKSATNEYKPMEKYTVGNPWDAYKSWYKVTKEAPNTGDPTGFLEKRHNGKKAFREIYINSVGAAVQQGHAPYKYPEGTILVKETYKNKAAYDKGTKNILTIMIKQKAGSSPETGDWGFVMGARGKISTGTSKWAKFCTNCHVFAAGNDYVFMNADFMATQK